MPIRAIEIGNGTILSTINTIPAIINTMPKTGRNILRLLFIRLLYPFFKLIVAQNITSNYINFFYDKQDY